MLLYFLHTKNFYKKIKQIRYEKLEKIANILRDSMWAIWIDNSINESSKLEILLPRQDLASEKILAYENEIKSKVDIYTSEKDILQRMNFIEIPIYQQRRYFLQRQIIVVKLKLFF